MAHIAFIDANVPGLDTMGCAREAGHRVSFVRALGGAAVSPAWREHFSRGVLDAAQAAGRS